MDGSFLSLSQSTLFQGIAPDELDLLTQCIKPEIRHYKKNTRVYSAGDIEHAFGLILQGHVLLEQDTLWGNHTIFRRVEQGHIFAETYAFPPGEQLAFNVIATDPAVIMFWNVAAVLSPCEKACPHHWKLIRNLVSVTAKKNLELYRRINHTAHKTIRGRLISYLSAESLQQGSYHIVIPFNRQQLADYLGVDRSALSNEIGKMQREGLLTTKREDFFLHHLV